MNILREQKETSGEAEREDMGRALSRRTATDVFWSLPKGMKAETNWTKDNGKLNAVSTGAGVTEQ
ncbi:hypothetical protein ACKUF3_28190 (plasmid) [Escherichia coli]